MNKPYTQEEQAWLDQLQQQYSRIYGGVCMATIRYEGSASATPCEGEIGNRHAIAKRHLKLIADSGNKIRANREIASFEKWLEKYDGLQSVPISRFSAGRWSCQKHDERFAGIDAAKIDLAKPENLFKAIYRAVLRHNHLSTARWTAVYKATSTDEGWEQFREMAFESPVGEDEAAKVRNQWRNRAGSLMSKTREFERRLIAKKWDSLDYRVLLLKSRPSVAGWGCAMMSFDTRYLAVDDPRREWGDFAELAFMVVIPQDDGHAIITACEKDTRFRVPEIRYIHDSMPVGVPPDKPYQASEKLKLRISRKIWGLNELGFRESLYQSWSTTDQCLAQQWMKQDRSHLLTHPERAPEYLPCLLQ